MTEHGFAPCPDTPNCVSSLEADSKYFIEPLTFEGSLGEARKKLLRVIKEFPRTKVIEDTGTYVHAVCTSLLFRFTDDLEFLIDDDNKIIHMKSASRLGYSDFGVNRRRCEAIREEFNRLRRQH